MSGASGLIWLNMGNLTGPRHHDERQTNQLFLYFGRNKWNQPYDKVRIMKFSIAHISFADQP